MKELLTYIVQNLVDKPDEVSVTERKSSSGEIVYEVRVGEGDMGKVIGRQGKIVKQIRILMRTVAQRKGKRVSVDILD
ncbi:MAG: KH domain-containing protein [Oscillospiraceae bacterium]|nr:KH domain-containing protein [Oscillospiraceae bacterium]